MQLLYPFLINSPIYSTDLTYVKTAIHISDVSFYTLEELRVNAFFDTATTSSIAIKINGRDTAKYNQVILRADRCIVVGSINPAHTGLIIGLDQHNFHNLY